MPIDNNLYAVLDLGSNSFHLLIAKQDDQQLVYIDRVKDMVRLASYLNDDETISPEGIERALNSLRIFAERLSGIPAKNIRAIGTNTLRAASNTESFLTTAESIIGAPIEIITGDEEARLIWQGVSRDFPNDGKRRLVVDIGGGSTEFIVGKTIPRYRRSVYMGCVSFTKRYFPDGVITAKKFKRAVTATRSELQSLIRRFQSKNWDEANGASGTIRYIQQLLILNNKADHTIPAGGLKWLGEQLIKAEKPEKLELAGLESNRLPILPAGLAILTGIFEELGIEEMKVSEYSLKEGVISELVGHTRSAETHHQTVNYLVKKYRLDRMQAKRVEATALQFYRYLMASNEKSDNTPRNTQLDENLLRWAASLHEIGLSIGYAGYHKHSAYMIENTDMPGFSRAEQKTLSFMLLNHRRKLRVLQSSYGFKPDWTLVLVLRLACLFNRRRLRFRFPKCNLEITKSGWKITLPAKWLSAHPLTEEDLSQESACWVKQGLQLEIAAV